MEKIIIHILAMQMLKLSIKYFPGFIKTVYRPYGELGGKIKAVPGQFAHHLAHKRLAFAAVVRPCGVKIVYARLICAQQQRLGPCLVYIACIVRGETHTAVS